MENMENGIKSKDRVSEFGEVYTPDKTVKDMMNQEKIKEESYRLQSKWLEPACGNGNFLVEMIDRKMQAAEPEEDYDLGVIKAIASIYGVDIIPDNVHQAKQRMLEIIKSRYTGKTGVEISGKVLKTAEFILDKNIMLGNALTNKKLRIKGKITKQSLASNKVNATEELGDLVVSDWEFTGESVVRVDCLFSNIELELNHYDAVNYKDLYKQKDKSDGAETGYGDVDF